MTAVAAATPLAAVAAVMLPITPMAPRKPTKGIQTNNRVTISMVAARAGVSPMTVSRVINDPALVQPQTREIVEQAIADLSYVPNRAARSLTVRRLGVIAVVLPDLSNPFFAAMASGVEERSWEAGVTVTVGNSYEDPAREEDMVRSVAALGVDGVVLAPTGEGSHGSVELLTRLGIPVVLIDRSVRDTPCDIVVGESVNAADALVTHLIEHGHRSIAVLAGPKDLSTSRDRVRGWRRALRRAGIDPAGELIVHGGYTRDAAREAGKELLSRRPGGAVFAANNFLGFAVVEASRELGLRVPDDVALVTFDDVEVTPQEPLLTCADVPAEEMGASAAALLFDRLQHPEAAPQRVVVPSELRIRRSCGCPDGEIA